MRGKGRRFLTWPQLVGGFLGMILGSSVALTQIVDRHPAMFAPSPPVVKAQIIPDAPAIFTPSPALSVSEAQRVLSATDVKPLPPAEQASATPDCSVVSCVALTFDDGPDPATTPLILDVLDQEHIKATFFVIGLKVAGNEALLQRMHASGHEIGNHSWSHPDFTKLKPEQIAEQINRTQEALVTAGVGPATVFRLPYGYRNDTVRQNLTLPSILWNVDPRDWQEKDVDQLIVHTVAATTAGSIIELHDIKPVTAAALRPIIHELEIAHLHPVTVSQLLNLTPASRGEFSHQ